MFSTNVSGDSFQWKLGSKLYLCEFSICHIQTHCLTSIKFEKVKVIPIQQFFHEKKNISKNTN